MRLGLVGRIVRRVMHSRVMLSAIACSITLLPGLVGLVGCAAKRTVAATQTTPAAFDPGASDAQAITTVDEMMAALGGAEAWQQVKQVRWELQYYQNDELLGWVRHSWDIWNGRHRYEFSDSSGVKAYNASGGAELPLFTIAMYDLFDHQGKGVVTNSAIEGTPQRGAVAADRDRIVAESFKSWQRDSYQLAMLYKLKDPGVKLSYVGERENFGGKCEPGCIDIKVTFVPEVGNDLYHVLINKQSKLPEVIAKDFDGTRSVAFRIASWAKVGEMQFPAVLQNVGPNEEFRIKNIQIGEPEDELYVPRVFN